MEYILRECLECTEIKEYMFRYILTDCYCCKNKTYIKKCIHDCMETILGFQYYFLDKISNDEECRAAVYARRCLNEIENCENMQMMVDACPSCNE